METIKTSRVRHILNVLEGHRAMMDKMSSETGSKYYKGQADAMAVAVILMGELINGMTYDPDPDGFDLEVKEDHHENSLKRYPGL